MGLASLLVSILAIVTMFLLLGFYGFGVFVSFGLAVLSLIFGIIGARKKEGTATAGIILSILVIAADIFLYFILFHGHVKLF